MLPVFDRQCPICGEAYTPKVNAHGKPSPTCGSDECEEQYRHRLAVRKRRDKENG
jgi:hypothetical protein